MADARQRWEAAGCANLGSGAKESLEDTLERMREDIGEMERRRERDIEAQWNKFKGVWGNGARFGRG